MQAFTAQPLADQTHDNPFTNSYLLATLIIPPLETYLAAHSEVRFLLLEYPPDHLSTVLALQKLVGVDLMKVAQIVDSNAKEPLPFTHIRGASISGRSNDGPVSPGQSPPGGKALPPTPITSPESPSFSKANYLLTSAATDSEIATFISTIWKILMDTSQYYIPEDNPKAKSMSSRRNMTPSLGTLSPFPRISPGPQSPPLSPANTNCRPQFRPSSPVPSSKAPSIAETVKTTKSSKSKRGKSRKNKDKDKVLPELETTLDFDPADDSDYDMETKRLMPMFMRKPPVRRGNSRKALKFLGLA
jgi:hypothetical protein